MSKYFRLRDRILLGYTVPVAFFIGIAGMVYSTANQVLSSFQEVERVQNVILGTENMALTAQSMIRSVRGYIAVKNEDFLKEYQMANTAFQEATVSVEYLIKNEDQRLRLRRMIELQKQYIQFSNEVIRLVQQNKQSEAINLFNTGKGTAFVKEFDRLTKEFNRIETEFLQRDTNQTKESLNSLIMVVIVGSLLLVVIAVLIAWLISSGVAHIINQAVNSISSSSAEFAVTVEQQERMATQQAAAVNQTSTTMDELGASSKTTAEQAEGAAVSARQALSLAQGGTQAVESTLEGMSNLKERVAAIAEQILHLSEQTNQIGNISSLVSDLANQTNMLALNAAVEAVRAGEHGKGFAVVATEIRKLADQSKKSAEKINGLVADIQNAINSTVMVTDEGTKKVDEGVQIARKTAEAFTGVTEAVNDMVVNNQQISLNIKQQAIAIQQVVEAMNALNRGAKETANGMSQTKLGSHNLNEAALNLKTLI